MLRYSFLPSDFHPIVLMLGEASDLEMLSRVLRRFSQSQGELKLNETEGFARSDTEIVLTNASERCGMLPVSIKDKIFRWSLDELTAEYFAELVDELAEHDRKSGSERLVCGLLEEIPVKVSRGEFTDDYLRFERRVDRMPRGRK